MSTKKDDQPKPCGPTTTDSKLATSTEKLDIKDKDKNSKEEASPLEEHMDEDGDEHGGEDEDLETEETGVVDLDSVLVGGCSTCGSEDHDDDDCKEDADPIYMMSTALPPPTPTSTSTSTPTFVSSMSGGNGGRGGLNGSKKTRSK